MWPWKKKNSPPQKTQKFPQKQHLISFASCNLTTVVLNNNLMILTINVLKTNHGLQFYKIKLFQSCPDIGKMTSLRPSTPLKKRLWHRCFLVSFAKFLRKPFLQDTCRLLLFLITITWKKKETKTLVSRTPFAFNWFNFIVIWYWVKCEEKCSLQTGADYIEAWVNPRYFNNMNDKETCIR